MRAEEIVRAARGAGLTFAAVRGSIELRGPDEVRQQFMPAVAAAAKAIYALVQVGDPVMEAPAECVGYSARPCPSCGYVHGRLEPAPCHVCGSDEWVTSFTGKDGFRTCGDCWSA